MKTTLHLTVRHGDEAESFSLELDLQALFEPLLSSLQHLKESLMTDLSPVNTALDGLTTAVGSLGTDLQALIKQFQSGVPITDADVQAVVDRINSITATVQQSDATEQAILTPSPAPAPAPVPVAPPVAGTPSST